MAKIKLNIQIEAIAELDSLGRVKIISAALPNNAAIEQDFLKLSTVKQCAVRAQIRMQNKG